VLHENKGDESMPQVFFSERGTLAFDERITFSATDSADGLSSLCWTRNSPRLQASLPLTLLVPTPGRGAAGPLALFRRGRASRGPLGFPPVGRRSLPGKKQRPRLRIRAACLPFREPGAPRSSLSCGSGQYPLVPRGSRHLESAR